ncbi:MAG: hypothetical protein R3Y62_09095 [Eubacteriales bacterium]
MDRFQEMYLHMMRESEKAIRILIEAQQACEAMYISMEESKENNKVLEK